MIEIGNTIIIGQRMRDVAGKKTGKVIQIICNNCYHHSFVYDVALLSMMFHICFYVSIWHG